MARSVLAPIVAGVAGVDLPPTAADAAGSQWTYGSGRRYLLVHNGDVSPHTVTVAVPATVDGDLDVPDRVVTVAAGGYAMVRESVSERQPDGSILVDFDDVTSVDVWLIETG